MTANDSKSYITYLNKLIDQQNNIHHYSIGKSLLMLINLFWHKELRQILKLLSLKLMIKSELLSIRIFSKGFIESRSREIFNINSAMATNPWTFKIKDLNIVKKLGVFMKNSCCWANYKWLIIHNQIVIWKIKLK